MKIWITKYALSSGILERDAEPSPVAAGMMVVRPEGRPFDTEYYHGEGIDWHLTREAAVVVANAMCAKKLASLRKQIARLESLNFDAT